VDAVQRCGAPPGDHVDVENAALAAPGRTLEMDLRGQPGLRRGTAREVMRPLPCRAPVEAAASGCGRRTVEVPRASRAPAAPPGRPRRGTNPGPPQWSARRRVGIMSAAVEAAPRKLITARAVLSTRAGLQPRRGEA
jgi:hypothetical protein